MKHILPFIFLLTSLTGLYSQIGVTVDLVRIDGQDKVQMSLPAASIVDYWARRGISCDNIVGAQDSVIGQMRRRIQVSDIETIALQGSLAASEGLIMNLEAQNTLLDRRVKELERTVQSMDIEMQGLKEDVRAYRAGARKAKTFKNITYTVGGVLVAGIVYQIISG